MANSAALCLSTPCHTADDLNRIANSRLYTVAHMATLLLKRAREGPLKVGGGVGGKCNAAIYALPENICLV